MMKQEFNGKTLDEALSAAARALGTDVTLLSYNILPQSSGGLLSKLFQRGVRLEAWVDSNNNVQAAAREAVRQAMADAQEEKKPRGHNQEQRQPSSQTHHQRPVPQRSGPRQKEASLPIPRKNAAPAREDVSGRFQQRRNNSQTERTQTSTANSSLSSSETSGSDRRRLALNSDEAKHLLNELALQFVRGFDPTESSGSANVQLITEEEAIVSVSSEVIEELLIKSDRLSCAFEHLFKRIAQRKFGDVSGRISLNAGSASQLREEKLKQMALDIAEKVKTTGKTITLSSKSSQERRVIHLSLEHMEGIATKSVGIGENRKLVIYSTLRPQRNDAPRRRRQNSSHQQGASRSKDVDSDGLQANSVDGSQSPLHQPAQRDQSHARNNNKNRGRRSHHRARRAEHHGAPIETMNPDVTAERNTTAQKSEEIES